jgi:hypothetical protein
VVVDQIDSVFVGFLEFIFKGYYLSVYFGSEES